MTAPWVGKIRLGMAAPEGRREGRACDSHAYLIVGGPDGDSVLHTENNPNPVMLCGRQETVFWEDEDEQTDGMPSCRGCVKGVNKILRKMDKRTGAPKIGDVVKVGKYTITVEHDGSHEDCASCAAIRAVSAELVPDGGTTY